jgi:vacuolar-type H+-ATPase subunit E/Vma4
MAQSSINQSGGTERNMSYLTKRSQKQNHEEIGVRSSSGKDLLPENPKDVGATFAKVRDAFIRYNNSVDSEERLEFLLGDAVEMIFSGKRPAGDHRHCCPW